MEDLELNGDWIVLNLLRWVVGLEVDSQVLCLVRLCRVGIKVGWYGLKLERRGGGHCLCMLCSRLILSISFIYLSIIFMLLFYPTLWLQMVKTQLVDPISQE